MILSARNFRKKLQRNMKRYIVPGVLIFILLAGAALLDTANNKERTYSASENIYGSVTFDYPQKWGQLDLSGTSGETQTYYASNQDIALVLYHEGSGRVAFVKNTSEPSFFNDDELMDGPSRNVRDARQTLYLLSEGQERELFTKKESVGRMLDFEYSPQGNYLSFGIASTGPMQGVIIDLVTGQDIFADIVRDNSLAPNALPQKLHWSEDENILAINMALWEIVSPQLLVSEYGNPAKVKKVASWETIKPPLPDQLSLEGIAQIDIRNVEIVNGDIVQFEIEACENCYQDENKKNLRRSVYQYHALTQKLEQKQAK